MTATAIQMALSKRKAPLPEPRIRLVYDASRPVHVEETPEQPKRQIWSAISTVAAFCIVVLTYVAFFWAGAGLGKFEDDFLIRMQVKEIMATAEMPPPLQQIGDYDREKGTRK